VRDEGLDKPDQNKIKIGGENESKTRNSIFIIGGILSSTPFKLRSAGTATTTSTTITDSTTDSTTGTHTQAA
jgi:hypothetical protein